MGPVAIEISGVTKSFKSGDPVLRGVSLQIAKGEMVALIGASGSGKSTLIRTIAGLIPIDGRTGNGAREGEIRILGVPMQQKGRISGAAKDLRSRVGTVFQQFNLVPRLSVLTNVSLGLLGQISAWRGTLGRFSALEKKRAMHALHHVDIAKHALKRGSELSGGQQQRAAIARTLVQGAEILIADEPIASLDPSSARRVMDILSELNREDGITVLVSLHQVEYALNYCPRTIALRNGAVAYDGPSSALSPAFLGELYGADSEQLFLPGLNPSQAASPQIIAKPAAARGPAVAADYGLAAGASG
ncbi:MAG: phosphonate ABC transporter ATP-binding protein [Hyphomicrobiaceae bacterium]